VLLGVSCLLATGCPNGCSQVSKILNPTGTSVQSVTVSPLAAQVAVGATVQFTATVLPTGVSDRSVTWAVTPAGLATIDNNGLLTGVAAGQAVVVATTVANPIHTAQAAVTVVGSQ